MRSEKSLNWGSFKLFPPFALQKAVISSICFTKAFAVFRTLRAKYQYISNKTVENKNKIEKAGKNSYSYIRRGSAPQGAATTTSLRQNCDHQNQKNY